MSDTPPHQQDAMLKRLARIEGQVRGLQAMIRRGEDCEAIAQQCQLMLRRDAPAEWLD